MLGEAELPKTFETPKFAEAFDTRQDWRFPENKGSLISKKKTKGKNKGDKGVLVVSISVGKMKTKKKKKTTNKKKKT